MFSAPVKSELNATVRTLLNTLVSHFSFGMYLTKLEIHDWMKVVCIRDLLPSHFTGYRFIEYDLVQNRIIISLEEFTAAAPNDHEEDSKSFLNSMKIRMLINPITVNPFSNLGSKSSIFFTPRGYTKYDQNGIVPAVNSIIEIHYSVFHSETDRVLEFKCTAPLLSTGYCVRRD